MIKLYIHNRLSDKIKQILIKLKKKFNYEISFSYIDEIPSSVENHRSIIVMDMKFISDFGLLDHIDVDYFFFYTPPNPYIDEFSSMERSFFIQNLDDEISTLELNIINYIKNAFFKEQKRVEIIQIEKDINNLISNADKELIKIKNIHKKIVSITTQKYKGLKVFSKYSAGLESGSEYFDCIEKDNKLVVFLGSTKSYLVSTIMMDSFEGIKHLKQINELNLLSLIDNITKTMLEVNLDDAQMSCSLMVIDFSTLKVSGYNFGKNNMILNGQDTKVFNNLTCIIDNSKKAYFEEKIDRNSRLYLITPGFRKNSGGNIDNMPIGEYLYSKKDSDVIDCINDCFFDLKKDLKTDFLKYDAYLVCIEVDRNVIVQV